VRLIHPDNLIKVWDKIREGLLEVKNKASDGWMPEDVYMALKSGHSTLHITEENNEYTGFVVLTPMQDYRGKKLHIWAAYHTAGKAVEKYRPELVDMAKQIGAKRLCFESTRKGWEKFYIPTMTTYEYNIED